MRRIAVGLLLGGALFSSGCTMCQSCFDEAYPMYGGAAPREDRYYGRVGSRFAPAGPDVGKLVPYKRETGTAQLYSEAPTNPSPAPMPQPLGPEA